jgi:hypothetical protein
MLTAVEFNHQAKLMRNEIHNVWSDWCLAAKGDAIEAMRPQPIPETPFRLRHIVT